jgi:hypothetical protein
MTSTDSGNATEPGTSEQDWNQRGEPQTLNSHERAPLADRCYAIVNEHKGSSHEPESSQQAQCVGCRNPPFAVDSVNQRPSECGQQYASGQSKRHEQARCPIESLCEPFPRVSHPGKSGK